MTESEDIIQRRREKILSRATSEQNEEDLDATSTASGKSNVFDRYKLLKEKEENERILVNASRYVGLLTFALSFVLPPWAAFTIITVVLIYGAYAILSKQVKTSNEFDWVTKKIPLLAKLKHLDLIILIAKVVMNSLLSFIMATVLLNAAYHFHQKGFQVLEDL